MHVDVQWLETMTLPRPNRDCGWVKNMFYNGIRLGGQDKAGVEVG